MYEDKLLINSVIGHQKKSRFLQLRQNCRNVKIVESPMPNKFAFDSQISLLSSQKILACITRCLSEKSPGSSIKVHELRLKKAIFLESVSYLKDNLYRREITHSLNIGRSFDSAIY